MRARELKEWLENVPDEAEIEHKYYGWGPLSAEDIRATYIGQPTPRPKEGK